MHYAPTAALPCFLLVHSALSPCPLPIPPSHISEFPLIRILRVNPSYSSFHSGLAFSPLAKRTIAWERQDKRPPCWWCAVLDRSSSLFFSPFHSFFPPLTETDSYSSSLSLCLLMPLYPRLTCLPSADCLELFSLYNTHNPCENVCPSDQLLIALQGLYIKLT